MRIKGNLIFISERGDEMVKIVAHSLSPDNLCGMETVIDEDRFTVKFKGDKVGTVLSSVDDYLMNAKIASDIINII